MLVKNERSDTWSWIPKFVLVPVGPAQFDPLASVGSHLLSLHPHLSYTAATRSSPLTTSVLYILQFTFSETALP